MLEGLNRFFDKFGRKKSVVTLTDHSNDDSGDVEFIASQTSKIPDWFSERYENAITQRNILLLILLGFIFIVAISVIAVALISTSKTFQPFVIKIDKNTGNNVIVNPLDKNVLLANESLNHYFIRKYINARESYNPVNFDFNMRKVVMLLSTSNIYRDYIGYIRNKANDPILKYGNNNTTFVRISSITKFDNKYFVRFSVNETAQGQNVFNKIATLTFNYIAMDLNGDDRDINPVGFVITGYGVSDDNT